MLSDNRTSATSSASDAARLIDVSTEVAVAIIAAVAAVVGPTLVWLATRQQMNDSRALINKDLDLAERLTNIGPSTEEYAKLLIGNVLAQIDALVARDHARRGVGKSRALERPAA